MKTINLIAITVLLWFSISSCQKTLKDSLLPGENDFNTSWKFVRDSTINAQVAEFDDSKWRLLDVPHDWSIEDLPNQDDSVIIGPFNKKSIGTYNTGYTDGGIGWYRKKFFISEDYSGKVFKINFDGIYNQSEVWVNGTPVGQNTYGYVPFSFDITNVVKPNAENTIAVKVKNLGINSRWYSGSGIYRNVTFSVLNPIHVETGGTKIETSDVSSQKAKISYTVAVKNSSKENIEARVSILDNENGKEVLSETKQITDSLLSGTFEMNSPKLWSTEKPSLYHLKIELLQNGKTVDVTTEKFGVRSIEFSAEKGFLLNGVSTKLRGGCLHHDNGLLGSAAYNRAEMRKVEIMKANGFNAVRTSHNPVSQAFLDACDSLGMLVIAETFDMWIWPKTKNDNSVYFKENWKNDLNSILKRDQNHPSIIMWSIANEIGQFADTTGVRIGNELKNFIKSIDNTRPVTAAVYCFWENGNYNWAKALPALQVLEISGYNYVARYYVADHKSFPKRIMYGSESFPLEFFDYWKPVENNPFVIGDFVWTAIDYLGESGIGQVNYAPRDTFSFFKYYPYYNSMCGNIDICGNKKSPMLYRDVLWNNSAIEVLVHEPIPAGQTEKVSQWGWPNEFPHWNWSGNEGKDMQVSVYSRAEKVRLMLNDKVIGEQETSENNKFTARFNVPYSAGTLSAVALKNNQIIATKELKTTGKVTSIRLSPDRNTIRASRNDLSYIMVEAIDEHGQLVQTADNTVTVLVSGNGEWLASGNSSPTDMRSFRKQTFKLFEGKGQIIVRPLAKKGSIKIEAKSEGLKAGECGVNVD